MVDVKDTENIWCKATIERILKIQGAQTLYYIHYDNWNRYYDEFISEGSDRMAPLGLYTS